LGRYYWIWAALILILLAGCADDAGTSSPAAEPQGASEPERVGTVPADPTELATPLAEEPATVTPPPAETVAPSPSPSPEGDPAPSPTAAAAEPEATVTTRLESTPSPEPPAEFDPEGVSIRLEPLASGFQQPLRVTSPLDGSGRLFVVEKGGRIYVLDGQGVAPDPFLDIRDRVSNGYEQGLLGLAFEPGRPERFYINYTDPAGNTMIVRLRVMEDANAADMSSGELLLRLDQPAANHNGGNLVFGPDGYLWIGTGDGGGAGDRFNQGQNPRTLLGAMLRIDVSGESGYSIPPDNPYAAGGDGAPEVWAYGLRNPWRYSFDRETGDLWLADVGQGAWEEVNRTPSDLPALNFGWPILEGSHCYARAGCSAEGTVLPVAEYDHSVGCSVTGGYVYRGERFPELRGGYFFADFCSGRLWSIPATIDQAVEPTLMLETGLAIASFGEDEAGELYLAAFDGTVYRLVSDE
jgi:glucose/arabinose dehydrogenase